jgi:uncharacterized repeat protein (TIGR03803 family)
MALLQAQTATKVVLHKFTEKLPQGVNPYAGVIRDSAGNLYGTTSSGGTGWGVVYKVGTAGKETVLHSFAGRADGASPSAGLIRDSAGTFYGTTWSGGPANEGVVFKLDTGGNYTMLYSFTGGTDGGGPSSGVVLDTAGNLYGTTAGGGTASGTAGGGVVYRLDTAGQETVLYSFPVAGARPTGVIRDSAGNLYGTLAGGGEQGAGVVYKLDTGGNYTVLYSFLGGADGDSPNGGLIRDSAGNLYGTTYYGGTGAGVLYKVNPAGFETVLYSFTGGADGSYPSSGVIRDSAGSFYGTTSWGGAGAGTAGHGVVYKVDTAGHETVLYAFRDGLDGGGPNAGLIRDSVGNFYGTTVYGGAGPDSNSGVVYKLDPTGNETVLYRFPGGPAGGAEPDAGVIRDSAGNLYGTTYKGGAPNAGVVYELDIAGQYKVLYTFTGGADGGYPYAGVISDSAGNLYGTTYYGGAANAGVVFKLDTAGHETVLYAFTGGADGGAPYAGVISDSAGNLYGTASGGGAAGWGVVYKLDTAGQETVLYSFKGGADGGKPYAGVISDSAGNLYGTTLYGGVYSGVAGFGVVYKLDTTGHETVLHTFTGGSDGGTPYAGVITDSAGNLYGTTYYGGRLVYPCAGSGCGVVYELDSAGNETVLYKFTGTPYPKGGLTRDSAGNLYGTTYAGVVYELSTTGQETALAVVGNYASASVIRDSAGNLYGTTTGGDFRGGTVFKIEPQ